MSKMSKRPSPPRLHGEPNARGAGFATSRPPIERIGQIGPGLRRNFQASYVGGSTPQQIMLALTVEGDERRPGVTEWVLRQRARLIVRVLLMRNEAEKPGNVFA